jgi:hypothetical protein
MPAVDVPDEHRKFTGAGQSATVRQTMSCRLLGHVVPATQTVSSGAVFAPDPQQMPPLQSCGPRH